MPVNNISVARYDRPDWIVQKEKFNRYKIVNYKPYKNRSKGYPRGGKMMFVYDYGDSLTLVRSTYSAFKNSNGQMNFSKSGKNHIFRIKIKDNHLIVWKIEQGEHGKKIRNISNNIQEIKDKIMDFGQKNIYAKSESLPTNTVFEYDEDILPSSSSIGTDIPGWHVERDWRWREIIKTETRVIKSINPRLNAVLKHFLRRNKIKFKYGKDFFENLRVACYPYTAGFPLQKEIINSCYSRHFLHGDIKYVIKQCFGHDSSKLVKLVCERIAKDKHFDCLLIGKLLKKLVPIDYLQQSMNADISRLSMVNKGAFRFKIKDCRALLKKFNAARILKLVQDEGFSTFEFSDSVNMWAQRGHGEDLIQKPKNWHEIHEFLVPLHRKAQEAAKHFDLPVSKKLKEIDGQMIGDLRVEIPKHTKDLRGYSDKMHNCIWSYGQQVKQGYCKLIALYRKDELLYNISFNSSGVSQFLGSRNQPADPKDERNVLEYLMEKKIIPADDKFEALKLAIHNGVLAEPVFSMADDNVI